MPIKNLKKSTGTMKKKDVYYKVIDFKNKKVEWPKIVAIAGVLEPTLKKDVEEYKEDGNLEEPYLKLGRVKKTLVMRIKDGKKHIGEWVLNDKFTPPTDLTGKDQDYARRLKDYVDGRNELLDRMEKLYKAVEIMKDTADKHAENIEKLTAGVPAFKAGGDLPKAQKALELAKKQLQELEKIGAEAERQLKTSENMQDEQRGWKVSTLQLDQKDYNEHSDTWWQIVKIGQDITSSANGVKALVPGLADLLKDVELDLNDTVKSSEQVTAELEEVAQAVHKILADTQVYLGHIEGHRNRFQDLKTQFPTLKDSDARQELYDAEVPRRIVNSEGYVGRVGPNAQSLVRNAKRLQRLKPSISTVNEGEKKLNAILAEVNSARDVLKNMQTTHPQVVTLGGELEEMIGED
jgi:hypothetical protein